MKGSGAQFSAPSQSITADSRLASFHTLSCFQEVWFGAGGVGGYAQSPIPRDMRQALGHHLLPGWVYSTSAQLNVVSSNTENKKLRCLSLSFSELGSSCCGAEAGFQRCMVNLRSSGCTCALAALMKAMQRDFTQRLIKQIPVNPWFRGFHSGISVPCSFHTR